MMLYHFRQKRGYLTSSTMPTETKINPSLLVQIKIKKTFKMKKMVTLIFLLAGADRPLDAICNLFKDKRQAI